MYIKMDLSKLIEENVVILSVLVLVAITIGLSSTCEEFVTGGIRSKGPPHYILSAVRNASINGVSMDGLKLKSDHFALHWVYGNEAYIEIIPKSFVGKNYIAKKVHDTMFNYDTGHTLLNNNLYIRIATDGPQFYVEFDRDPKYNTNFRINLQKNLRKASGATVPDTRLKWAYSAWTCDTLDKHGWIKGKGVPAGYKFIRLQYNKEANLTSKQAYDVFCFGDWFDSRNLPRVRGVYKKV